MYFWNILEIAPTNDKKIIKKAYARLIKQHKPETSPEAYQKIREAYDKALNYIKNHPLQIAEQTVATEKLAVKVVHSQSKPSPDTTTTEKNHDIETEDMIVEISKKSSEIETPEPEEIDDSQK